MRTLPGMLLALVSGIAVAGTYTHDLQFSPTELSFGRWQEYDVVELERGHVVPNPGKPCLPMVAATLVVPADAEVLAVTATPVTALELVGTFHVAPSQPGRPVSAHEELELVQPDPLVYSSSVAYPTQVLAGFHVGTAGGFRLVGVDLCPFEYRPVDQRLSLHTRIRVVVSYRQTEAPAQVRTPKQIERSLAGLNRFVTNPTALKRFSPPSVYTDQPSVDYLVVTGDALAAEFEPFVEHRTARGLRTELRTVEWVDRNYPGRDSQERLRNLIIDYYQNRGLSYVLLAGDNSIVPARRIRVRVGSTQGDVPTDLYYADLDYSWDSNHNGLFGEMSDSVDLYADVILGRASVDKPSQAQAFIAKVQTYEEDPATDYLKRSLLPSGWLWRSIGYHGRFVNDSIAAITPHSWTDVKMENPASAMVVADSFDNGFAVFDPAGHGNESGVYDENGTSIYTSGVARNQQNSRRFTIMTSLACNPGNFEAEDCLAEVSHNCATGGCIAVMMNSRYGWGTPPAMGPSEKLCVRFYDHLFNRAQYELGTCHSRSREEYAASARYDQLWRWCMTEFNLLGDPALDIWTESPVGLSMSCPDTVLSGAQDLNVLVIDSNGPVAGALVCAWKADETHATATANSSGQASLAVHPVTSGDLRLTATSHNHLAAVKHVAVLPGNPEPFLVFESVLLDDTGQPHANGILEPGETAGLTLTVRNSGTAAATDATVLLSSLADRLLVPDSLTELGTVPAGASVQAVDLSVSAAPDIAPGSNPEVLARVTSAEAEWELVFSVDIGYPGRTVADIDTGCCALSITARGAIGFDEESNPAGRGFRFPESDTSSLRAASFCVADSADFVVDRFYTPSGVDRDWILVESLYTQTPKWNSPQVLRCVFSDAGHPTPHNLRVIQQGIGISGAPDLENAAILVYDVVNDHPEAVTNLYAGILADFDVVATDRLHDVARTDPELRTAYMRNVNDHERWCGVKLLYPELTAALTCLDHDRYVYPDSGLSEDMKLRALKAELGVPSSDRPYNWSVSVGIGPFGLASGGGRQRVAFAFLGAADSVAYLDACRDCQDWFDLYVGMAAPDLLKHRSGIDLSAYPNPFRHTVVLNFAVGSESPAHIRVYDTSGRRIASLHSGRIAQGQAIPWQPEDLPGGIYIIRLTTPTSSTSLRVTLVR